MRNNQPDNFLKSHREQLLDQPGIERNPKRSLDPVDCIELAYVAGFPPDHDPKWVLLREMRVLPTAGFCTAINDRSSDSSMFVVGPLINWGYTAPHQLFINGFDTRLQAPPFEHPGDDPTHDGDPTAKDFHAAWWCGPTVWVGKRCEAR